MKVSHKLALLPVGALAGIALVSIILIRTTGTVYESANYGNARVVPSLTVLNALKAHFLEIRLLIWQHIGAQDPAMMADIEKKIAAHRQAENEALKAYEPLISDATDRAMLDADREAVVTYDAYKAQGMTLSRGGQKAQAADFFIKAKPQLAKLVDTLGHHIDYHATLAAHASEAALQQRRSAQRTGIVLALVTLGFVGGLGIVIFRQLMRQLGGEPAAVAAVAEKVAEGDFSSVIDLPPQDRGSLLAAVGRMQASLRARAERDRQETERERLRVEAELEAATKSHRIRTALDGVSVGVMLADPDGAIIYANDFCMDLFRRQTAEIRKQIPAFDPERIIGSSFDAFHARAGHQRGLLAQLTQAHSADIKLGAATLRVIANAVVDPGGRRLGTVVQWIDRTGEVRVEEAVKGAVARANQGDLTVRLSEEGLDGFQRALAVGVNSLIENMASIVRAMSQAAAEVRTAADEIARGNLDLSQRTEEQASSLEQTAASMEEMTARVRNSADGVAQADRLASAARAQAEQGGTVVESAVAAMQGINVASRRIADIIGVIDEIAFQTNLLALNAAVEAARAGEGGKGFAVVASEVRALASRSANAAKEIKALIHDSAGKVEEGARLVDEAGRVLQGIVSGTKSVTDVVGEIAISSREQATGIEQVNKAVTAMDSVTQQNAALVEEASAAAEALTGQAARLAELIAKYKVSGERTVARVPRAA